MKKSLYLLPILLLIWFLSGFLTHPAITPASRPETDFLLHVPMPASLQSSFRAACYDCHSYETQYPWYSSVPIVSGWMESHVKNGRSGLNFSEWLAIDQKQKTDQIKNMIEVIKEEQMPLDSYKWMHPESVWLPTVCDSILDFLYQIGREQVTRDSLPDCEWCGMQEAPEKLSWKTKIPPPGEPGEVLIMEGRVFLSDGVTPAEGVRIYVYHTNARGIYPRMGDETGNGKRHGYLRGWMETNEEGRYRFQTIHPAPYPSRNDPAHIHITLAPPGEEEYWIASYWFEGDPLITPARRRRVERPAGKTNIVELRKDHRGVWRGARDIVLRSR